MRSVSLDNLEIWNFLAEDFCERKTENENVTLNHHLQKIVFRCYEAPLLEGRSVRKVVPDGNHRMTHFLGGTEARIKFGS